MLKILLLAQNHNLITCTITFKSLKLYRLLFYAFKKSLMSISIDPALQRNKYIYNLALNNSFGSFSHQCAPNDMDSLFSLASFLECCFHSSPNTECRPSDNDQCSHLAVLAERHLSMTTNLQQRTGKHGDAKTMRCRLYIIGLLNSRQAKQLVKAAGSHLWTTVIILPCQHAPSQPSVCPAGYTSLFSSCVMNTT